MILLGLAALFVCGMAGVMVFVEREADYSMESTEGACRQKALVLFHPSRDAHFSDDLSVAIGQGLTEAGYCVDRATLTGQTPEQPTGYSLLVVVSNTYCWTPDLPTLRYLKRAKLTGVPTVGVIAGGGSTIRSERLLRQALTDSGASVITMRAYWTGKPNDEKQPTADNRQVAMQFARQLGRAAGKG